MVCDVLLIFLTLNLVLFLSFFYFSDLYVDFFKVALVLPHADLVVCLDGNGGIAAVCAPSELSAALKQSMHETAQRNSINTLSNSILSISSSGGTDSEVTYSSTVIADTITKNGVSHHSSNTDKDRMGQMKKLTRSESNGFFDLLLALPGMGGEAIPPLFSSPSSSLSSSGQADESSSTSFFDTDATGSLDIFGDINECRNQNNNIAVKNGKDKYTGKEKGIGDFKAKRTDGESRNDNLPKDQDDLITKKNIDGTDDYEEKMVHQSAALLVEKETKSAGIVGIDVYWFMLNQVGG